MFRYKDGRIIALEDREDVAVEMTKKNKQVFSVLKIKNLSRHKYIQASPLNTNKTHLLQTWNLQLQILWAFNAERHPSRY